jgi:hypothetical protein
MITCGRPGQAAGGGRLPVQIKTDHVRLESVEAADSIGARLGDIDRVIAPFAIFGPADVKLVDVRADEIGVVEVRPIFDKGDIHAFVLSEMPNIFAGVGSLMTGIEVQLAAPVIQGIGVMVSDPFTAEIVQRALNDAGNACYPCMVKRVRERLPLVIRGNRGHCSRSEPKQADERCDEHPVRVRCLVASKGSVLFGHSAASILSTALLQQANREIQQQPA